MIKPRVGRGDAFSFPISENTLEKIQACMVGFLNPIGFDSQYVFTKK